MPDAPKIVWENTVKEVNEEEVYLEPKLFPAKPAFFEIGTIAPVYLTGIYQIDVKTPKGIGWHTATDLIDKLLSHFPRNLVLIKDDMSIKIINSYANQGMIDFKGVYTTPVSVEYYSFYM